MGYLSYQLVSRISEPSTGMSWMPHKIRYNFFNIKGLHVHRLKKNDYALTHDSYPISSVKKKIGLMPQDVCPDSIKIQIGMYLEY